MANSYGTVLVFGVTGQQGGSVAHALRSAGWPVRALARNPDSDRARSLAAQGVEFVRGDLADRGSVEAAMAGVYGVFSVQPSSGQGASYGVSDEDEIRYGTMVADLAAASGARHFVYSSANAAGPARTGVGHFDSKSEIEAHLRRLELPSTIIRPSAFMEILMLPGLGLDRGTLSFFVRPNQPMQFIAVEDIGRIVAAVFADPARYVARTIEIAGDSVTGEGLVERFGRAAGRPIVYRRFPESLLEKDRFLNGLAGLVDDGRLAGKADIAALRREFPGLQTVDQWLARGGGALLRAAIASNGAGIALR